MKVVFGMKVVWDFGMKVFLDEKFWDEKCQFHPNLDESVPNRLGTENTNGNENMDEDDEINQIELDE